MYKTFTLYNENTSIAITSESNELMIKIKQLFEEFSSSPVTVFIDNTDKL